MRDVKNISPAKITNPHLLKIKEQTSFTQTLKKLNKSTHDFVWVQKPKTGQMLAVLLARLWGKKFYWLQSFSNPPVPGFFNKLLLSQADRIVVRNRKDMFKLLKFGINKHKIRINEE